MDRYASRLSSYLRSLNKDHWAFTDLIPNDVNLFRKENPTSSTYAKLDDILSRFIVYPPKAFFSSASLYHIIDHGYSHLAYALRGRKMVVTCNDLVTFRLADGSIPCAELSSSSVKKFRWIVAGMQYAKSIIAISNSTKQDLIKFLAVPEEKIKVIYDGVDNLFQPTNKADARYIFRDFKNIPVQSKLILHLSGVSPRKNIEGVIRTLAILVHGYGIQTHLLRVGGPLTKPYWILADSLGVTPYIHESGHIDDEQLVLAYNTADLLLFPSWWEGFGLPPLEAMACGTPVILSNRASLPEVAGDAGVLIAPDDYEGMASAARRIFEDDAYRKMLVARGFSQAKRFTWEKVAEETFEVYQRIVEP